MAAAEHGAEQIERHRVLPHRQIDFGDEVVFGRRAARAVVEHVELAEALDGRRDRALHALLLPHVRFDEQRFAAGFAHHLFGRASPFTIDLGDDDARALFGKDARSRFGDTRTGAGDQGDLSFEPTHCARCFIRNRSRSSAQRSGTESVMLCGKPS